MDNKCLVISIIENFQFEERIEFQIDGWTFSNDFEKLSKIIPNLDSLRTQVGNMVVDLMIAKKTFVYRIVELINEQETHINILHRCGGTIQALLSLFWLQIDNSIYNQYVVSQRYDTYGAAISVRDTILSNCYGLPSVFPQNIDIMEVLDKINIERDSNLLHIRSSLSKEIEKDAASGNNSIGRYYSSYTRLQRCSLLLVIARATNFLPMKIGFYINVLECLLLDTSSEINFRLQLQVANFIGNSKEEKDSIMTSIKAGYNVRSKFFHGSGIKQKDSELRMVSQQLDEIVRNSLNKALDNHEVINNDKELKKYLDSIMFS